MIHNIDNCRADPNAAAAPSGGAPTGEGGSDEIVGGPRNPQQIAAQKRLQQTQAQVDEVIKHFICLAII